MRTLWNALSFMAVVHLLALLIFAGWLWKSGRLDEGRLHAARDLFTTTVAEDEAAAIAVELAAADAAAEAAALDRAQNPRLPSAVHATLRTQLRSVEHEVARRLDAERQRLSDDLERRSADLDRREAELARREAALDLTEIAEQARDAEAQFEKVVTQYELASPKVAKGWALNLVAEGKTETLVGYLDAMDPRAAKKILNEFKTEAESTLAAQLLEQVAGLADAPSTAAETDDGAPESGDGATP